MTDTKPRGLAALTFEERRRIQSLGGKASTHRWTHATARAAGHKGGRSEQKIEQAFREGYRAAFLGPTNQAAEDAAWFWYRYGLDRRQR